MCRGGEEAQCLALGISSPVTSRVIYNGIPSPRIIGHQVIPEFAGKFRPVILTLARFEYQKNMPLALDTSIGRMASLYHDVTRTN